MSKKKRTRRELYVSVSGYLPFLIFNFCAFFCIRNRERPKEIKKNYKRAKKTNEQKRLKDRNEIFYACNHHMTSA